MGKPDPNTVLIDLHLRKVTCRVIENGMEITYVIEKSAPSKAVYRREVWNDAFLNSVSQGEYALAVLSYDPSFPPLVQWLARGLVGIPNLESEVL